MYNNRRKIPPDLVVIFQMSNYSRRSRDIFGNDESKQLRIKFDDLPYPTARG
jgi:hypothetical protein